MYACCTAYYMWQLALYIKTCAFTRTILNHQSLLTHSGYSNELQNYSFMGRHDSHVVLAQTWRTKRANNMYMPYWNIHWSTESAILPPITDITCYSGGRVRLNFPTIHLAICSELSVLCFTLLITIVSEHFVQFLLDSGKLSTYTKKTHLMSSLIFYHFKRLYTFQSFPLWILWRVLPESVGIHRNFS